MAPVIYCKLFFSVFFFIYIFFIFDVIFSIAKGVQHDGRLPFWKPASVFIHYDRIVMFLLLAKYIFFFFFFFYST